MGEPRIWSVFDSDGRLVLVVSETPGAFGFARPLEEGAEGFVSEFASVQSYDPRAENDLLALLTRSRDIDDFLLRLERGRYTVVDGRPRPQSFARL